MYGLEAFGDDTKTHFSTSGYSTHSRLAIVLQKSQAYTKVSRTPKREYKQRIDEVEAAEFVPMVMSTSGGMGEAMVKALRRLASALADKTGETYSQLMGVLRCRFAFAMMRSALVCLRGTRSRVSNSNITYSNSWDMSSDMVSRELF